MLEKLAPFGGGSAQARCLDGAAFGVSLRATAPEDQFDRQPLVLADRWLFAADVRLDNRKELERALAIDGRELADSEILFEALIRWGEATLDRAVGDFAFALFDRRSKTLLLARDPTGQRPLYYALGKDFVAFASMASGLAGTPGVGNELNREALARVISDIQPAPNSSYFRAICKLSPGHFARITGGEVEVRDYWRQADDSDHWIERPDILEAYRSTLDEAVMPRLRRRQGGVSAQLSSGLDSSAVLSAAARLAGADNLLALTSAPADVSGLVSPRGRFPDESELAAEIAGYVGVRHIILRDTASAIGHLRPYVALYQEPYRNHTNGGWITGLAQIARGEGYEVMLTGDVGNLTLNGGSIGTLRDLLRAQGWRGWMRESWLATHGGGARWTGVLMNTFGYRLPAAVTRRLERNFNGAIGRGDATFLRRELVDELVLPALPLPHERRTRSSYADAWRVLRSYDFGNYNKGLLAECGVDMRHPLLDRRAIEFSQTVPPQEFFQDGRSRSLARRALAGRLPAKILTMSERGYQAADWYKRVSKSELLGMVEEIGASCTARDLLDLQRMRATIERWDQIDFADPAQNIAIDIYLSLALASGLFIVGAERGFPD